MGWPFPGLVAVGSILGSVTLGASSRQVREVSNQIIATSNQNITEDEGRSLAFMHWGQWVDHDLDLAPMTETDIHNKEGECDTSCHYAPPCFPIKVMELYLALEMSR